jgi:two-component system KDP operon response regulator KdpE
MAGDGRRVLIVDDEPVLCHMLETFLSQAGWICLLAEEPEGALRLLSDELVTHAIIDLRLGSHSGYDLIRAVASRRPEVRIVAITGSVIEGPPAALAAGAAVVMSKPFSPLRLLLDALEGKIADGNSPTEPER